MSEYTPSDGFGSDGKSLMSSSGGKGKGAGTKKKREKDPDAPKGMDAKIFAPSVSFLLPPCPPAAALSAYNYFCSKVRQQIKDEIPGIANTDIMKEAASRWKALAAEDKTPYERLAHEDKAR